MNAIQRDIDGPSIGRRNEKSRSRRLIVSIVYTFVEKAVIDQTAAAAIEKAKDGDFVGTIGPLTAVLASTQS